MDLEEADTKFKEIKRFYNKYSKEKIRSTKYGVWGPSDIDIIFKLFKKVNLAKYKNFIDLGSGDGRIVLIASLFTDAVGFEIDKRLMNLAKRARNETKSNAIFMRKNFLKEDITKYDCLFIYPDRSSHVKLKRKLLKELKGRLFVYKIYKPKYLKKIKDHDFGKIAVSEFAN
jgi:hypothetical protein